MPEPHTKQISMIVNILGAAALLGSILGFILLFGFGLAVTANILSLSAFILGAAGLATAIKKGTEKTLIIAGFSAAIINILAICFVFFVLFSDLR